MIKKFENFEPRKVDDRKDTPIGKQVEVEKSKIVTVTIPIDGTRMPGGSPGAIKDAYDIQSVDDSTYGCLVVTGSLWNVRNFLADYSNEFLLDKSYDRDGYGLHESFTPRRMEERKKDAERIKIAKRTNAEIDNLIRAVKDFRDAHAHLVDLWNTTTQQQDQALGKEYPFESSFDDYSVHNWYVSVKEELNKQKL
jgi:hypothetical protein